MFAYSLHAKAYVVKRKFISGAPGFPSQHRAGSLPAGPAPDPPEAGLLTPVFTLSTGSRARRISNAFR